jgi:hypothetical protein
VSEAGIVALFAALIAALPGGMLAFLAFRAAQQAAALAASTRIVVVENTVMTQQVKEQLNEVGLKVDGRFDALVADIRKVALAEGRAAGMAESEATAAELQRISQQSAADRAEGLAEGRAELRPLGREGER